jgi:hypothetical protein
MVKGLITQKEYARRRRISAAYVSKLVRKGVIELKNGMVDPKHADAARLAVSKPGRTAGKKAAARKGGRASAANRAAKRDAGGDSSEKASPTAGQRARSATDTAAYWNAQKLKAETELKQIELERVRGELLPRAEVKEAQERQNANVKMRIRRLARSVAPQLARITTASEIEQVLLEEIDLVLSELARDPLGDGPHELQTSAEMPPAMLANVTQAQEATC